MTVRAHNPMTDDTSQLHAGEEVTMGLRKAALLLHAASPADRRWLLDNLPGSRREQLSGLVDEISALGIPADPTLLHDVVDLPQGLAAAFGHDPSREHASEARLDALPHLLDVVDRAPPALLVQILRDEPPGLIVSLLELHAWSWRTAVLNQLGAIKRRQVEDLLTPPHESVGTLAAPALRRFLLASIARRLHALRLAQTPAAATATQRPVEHVTGLRAWWRRLPWRRPSGSGT